MMISSTTRACGGGSGVRRASSAAVRASLPLLRSRRRITTMTGKASSGMATSAHASSSPSERNASPPPPPSPSPAATPPVPRTTAASGGYNPNLVFGGNSRYRWLSSAVALESNGTLFLEDVLEEEEAAILRSNSRSSGTPTTATSTTASTNTTTSSSSDSSSDSDGDGSSSTTSVSSIEELLDEHGIERDVLEQLAGRRPTPLRLQDMYRYGATTEEVSDNDDKQSRRNKLRLKNAQFLHQELPVRIAQRAMDLLTLPHGLSDAEPIRQVAGLYLGFLRQLQDFPNIQTSDDEEKFTELLKCIVLDRTTVPMSIAQGVNAWWSQAPPSTRNDPVKLQQWQDEMDEALYRFFTARVGLRLITEQFILSSNRDSTKSLRNKTSMFPILLNEDADRGRDGDCNMVGCIQANCNVMREVSRVATLVTKQTQEYYGFCPRIEIVDCDNNNNGNGNKNNKNAFTYVPCHLHYMLAELLKNSCRASVRKYQDQLQGQGDVHDAENNKIPSIRIVIVKGEEDVTIKVADKGGGIPRSLMAESIWKFAHSTASEDELSMEFGTDGVSGAKIRGFGLPLARIYARYFGGELTLKSTEGYGLDAYLHLPRLGLACENLPLRVRSSPGEGISLPTHRYTFK